jgi:two-component system chemotaxis response regulator CheY
MKYLIVEDDFVTSMVMKEILSSYGECDTAVNGNQAIELVKNSLINNTPYNAVFLDIMMPEKDGQEVLAEIRNMESDRGVSGLDGVKIIMTTALDDFSNIRNAFKNQCDGYIVKPIDNDKVIAKLTDMDLIK